MTIARASRIGVVGLALVAALSACGSATPTPPAASPAATAADVTFLEQMLPHHQRAIEIAALAAGRANDPAVRAFAARIVREQTPELHTMQALSLSVPLDVDAGAAMADHRVSTTQLVALKTATGAVFDRMFVTLSIASEQGAVVMAQPEITGGRVPAAVALANAINSAPTGEIPQLQALLATLPAA